MPCLFLESIGAGRKTGKNQFDSMTDRLAREFYTRDVLTVAPDLLGKELVLTGDDMQHTIHIITETEAYRGMEDRACHASKGRTARTEVMYMQGGVLYMYLIYGMYWMLNIVTSHQDNPQAVLVRGLADISGPGRLTRTLKLDRTFNSEDLVTSERLYIRDPGRTVAFETHPRIGIDYAGDYWRNKPWRFLMKE